MNAKLDDLNPSEDILETAQNSILEIAKADFDKTTVRHFVLSHKSRAKSYKNAKNFILKDKDIDTVEYLIKLVRRNFYNVKKLVNAIENDGAVRLNEDTWGVIDLENETNHSLKLQVNQLIATTIKAENNPDLPVDTSDSNIGIVRLSYNNDNNHLYAVQRSGYIGKTAIDSDIGSWYRGPNNEAYIIKDTRYRILPNYDFFILDRKGQLSLLISNFNEFENTANFAEAQNHNVRKGFSRLVEDKLITSSEQSKLAKQVHSMKVREKSHLIKAIATKQHLKWTSLKEQQDLANRNLPQHLKWNMQFNSSGEYVYDGTPEAMSQFVKFISHTIVISASDENYVRDISGWVEA
ncbi:DUF4868 domain-containing protein [Vibrio vulnificus]|nr:hypothetical protein [Vibrio vulnificus]